MTSKTKSKSQTVKTPKAGKAQDPKKDKSAIQATEKARNAVIASIDQRLKDEAAPAASGEATPAAVETKPVNMKKSSQKEKAPKAPREPKEPKLKRVSALDAAAQVLVKATKPMRASELVEAMEKSGLWKSPGGKTPEATLYAAMIREIRAKGDKARFKKHERGVFVAGKGA